MSVRQSGRLSETSDIFHVWSYRLLKTPRALSAAAALLHVSANKSENHKWGHGRLSPQRKKETYIKWNENMSSLKCERGSLNVSNSQLHSWFPPKDWKVSETSSSQCLLGKNNKKWGLLWVKGMKVWLTGEITQSVSPRRAQTTCSLSAVWHKLTTPQHISLHSQQTVTTVSAWTSWTDISC